MRFWRQLSARAGPKPSPLCDNTPAVYLPLPTLGSTPSVGHFPGWTSENNQNGCPKQSEVVSKWYFGMHTAFPKPKKTHTHFSVPAVVRSGLSSRRVCTAVGQGACTRQNVAAEQSTVHNIQMSTTSFHSSRVCCLGLPRSPLCGGQSGPCRAAGGRCAVCH